VPDVPVTTRIKAALSRDVCRRRVIAYVAFGSPPATVEEARTQILDNLG
jgi:hypothetical protein